LDGCLFRGGALVGGKAPVEKEPDPPRSTVVDMELRAPAV